jgi:hypothetical protein
MSKKARKTIQKVVFRAINCAKNKNRDRYENPVDRLVGDAGDGFGIGTRLGLFQALEEHHEIVLGLWVEQREQRFPVV